jgi:MYXO-CTERM domain-containing protein
MSLKYPFYSVSARYLIPLAALVLSSGAGFATTASYDFNGTGIQPGDTLRGNATITNNELELTTAINSQTGSLVIRNLDPGQELTSFTSNFRIFMGNSTTGTAADGIGFSVGQALLASPNAFGEGGTRSGLTISFDTFGGGGPEGIDIRYYGRTIFEAPGVDGPSLANSLYVPVSVSFSQSLGLSLSYNGTVLVSNLDLNGAEPGMGFFHTDSRFTFGGRTGGFNQANFVDDIAISTTASGITRENILTASDTITLFNGSTPANEHVGLSIDGNWGTKYLNFDGDNTGLTVTPGVGSSIISALTLTSANDSPDRDPTSYTLMGSNDGINFTPIASGTVPAFEDRFATQLFEFSNSTAYTSYQLVFPTVNGSTLMQIAEVQLIGNAIPEPSAALLGLAAMTVIAARRRRNTATNRS